jgi:hypothetical protein
MQCTKEVGSGLAFAELKPRQSYISLRISNKRCIEWANEQREKHEKN